MRDCIQAILVWASVWGFIAPYLAPVQATQGTYGQGETPQETIPHTQV